MATQSAARRRRETAQRTVFQDVRVPATYPEIASALILRTTIATRVDGPSVATQPRIW
jgi:hypothetical protein